MTEEERRKSRLIYIEKEIIASQVCENDFIKEVEKAFAANIYPGDENLVSTAEHRAECEECRNLYESVIGKT